jgi:hypothetical protein
MTTKLEPKEKLADATRQQQAAQATYQSATNALAQFDKRHAILNAELTDKRRALKLAQAQALKVLHEAQEVLTFMDHEIYAMSKQWGRGHDIYRK